MKLVRRRGGDRSMEARCWGGLSAPTAVRHRCYVEVVDTAAIIYGLVLADASTRTEVFDSGLGSNLTDI